MLRDLLVEVGVDVDSHPLKELNREINELVRRLRKVDADPIESLNKEFSEMNRSVRETNKGLKSTDRRLSSLSRTINRINTGRIAEGFSDAEDEAKDFARAARDSADAIESLEDSSDDARRGVSRLNHEIKRADRSAEDLASTFRKIQLTIKSVTNDVNRLTREMRRLDRELDNTYVSSVLIGNEFRRMDLSHVANDSRRINENLDRSRRSAIDLSESMRSFSRDTIDVDTHTRRITRNFNDVNSRPLKTFGNIMDGIRDKAAAISSSWGRMAFTIPAVVPFIAAAANALGNLGPIVGVVGGGLMGGVGAVGTAGIGAMAAMLPIAGNISEVFNKEKEELNALELESQAYFKSLQDGYNNLLKVTEEPALAAFNKSMQIAQRLLKDLEPMFVSVTETVEKLMIKLSESLDTPQVQKFIDYLNKHAAPMLDSVATSAGYLLQGLGNIIVAFEPLSTWVAQGLENMSKSFADWAYSLSETEGFKKFVEYTKENLPKLGEIFGDLTLGLVDFFAAFSGSASGMLDGMVKMAGDFRQWAAGLADSQEFNDFLNYVREVTPEILKLVQNIAELGATVVPVFADIGQWILKTANGFLEFVNSIPTGFSQTLVKIAIGIGMISTLFVGLASVIVGLTRVLLPLYSGFNFIRSAIDRFKNRRNGTQTPGRTILGDTLDRTFGRRSAANTWPNPNDPNNPWTQMDREFNDRRNGRNRNVPPTPSPFANDGGALASLARRHGMNADDVLRDYQRDMATPQTTGGSSELLRAATNLNSAADTMKRALSNIKCVCDCGPAGGGRSGRGRGGRGGSSPAGDLDRQTRSNTRSARHGGNSPVDDLNRQTRTARNAGGDKWYNKLGKVGKAGGIAGLALGGVSLVGSLANGDYRSAAGNGGALAGGAAGAAAGAALGSIVPGIGTAIGGIAGGIIGSIGGSTLGTKLYDGIKSFDWSGLKSVASNTGQAVSNTWNSLKTATGNAWNSMTSGMSGAMTGAKNAVSSTVSALGGGLSSAWSGIKSVAGGAWNGVKSTLSNSMNSAKSAVSNTASALSSGLSATWNATKSVASTVWNNLKSDMSAKSTAAKTAVSNTFNAMKSGLSSTWNGLKSIASSAWSGITGAITSSVSGAVSKATSMLNGLKGAISGIASKAWSGIKNGANKVKNWVMGSHATGLGRVPFDGYIAELHKNEAVLTANQANALRSAGILKGDGVAPQLNMSQATTDVAGYSPLEVAPGTTATTNTTNNNGTVRASVTINVNGAESPEKVAINVKDELEKIFSVLMSGTFPSVLEG